MKLTKNFNLHEFRCRDKNETPVPDLCFGTVLNLAKSLQVLRDVLGEPIKINSSYRTKEHNESVGGSKRSQHLWARAADIVVKNMDPLDVADTIEYLIEIGEMRQGGIGIYDTFIHYDTRGTEARWDYSNK